MKISNVKNKNMVKTYGATSQIFIAEKSKIRKDSKLRLKKRNIPRGSIVYNRRCHRLFTNPFLTVHG